MKPVDSSQVVQSMERRLAEAGLDDCEVSAEWVLRLTTMCEEKQRRQVYGVEWEVLREFDIPIDVHVKDK